MDRQVSTNEALRLLNSAWTTKSAVWINARWDALTKIFSAALAALSKRYVNEDVDITNAAEEILKTLKSNAPNVSRAILLHLVDFARAFGFSGVCVLVDKVDETPDTANSAESTALLVFPALNHIQLLEIYGFSWVFFLWSKVQHHFQGKHAIRLDKIAHANITWDGNSLRDMVEARINFFSEGKEEFRSLFDAGLDGDEVFKQICEIGLMSPREIIRIMDMLFREHDARGAEGLLDKVTLDVAFDKYAIETIGTWYQEKYIQQAFRLGMTSFVNRDVQSKFKIGDQGARVKIKNWEEFGLVRQDGTVPSDLGGKPVYRYVITDPRAIRIINRKLVEIVGADIEADEAEE